MDYRNLAKEAFDKVISFFDHELSTLRTGRASVGLLATVVVDVYGSTMALSSVASVTVADAKTLVISPWDKTQISAISKGIMQANIGLTPSDDGNVVRISIPSMTEERRKEIVKMVGQMAERARIGIRKDREDIIKSIKKSEEEGEIGKDESTSRQKKLQEIVDEYNDIIKQMASKKEDEVMTV